MRPASASASPLSAALGHGARLLRDDPPAAAAVAREILRTVPDNPDALRLLGRAQRKLGLQQEAEAAELAAIAASARDPLLIRAGRALVDNDIPAAEALLRSRLKANPFDVAAIRMMAEVAARIGRFADAENLLRRALELAPAFIPARVNLAMVLQRQHRSAEALGLVDGMLIADPDDPRAQSLKAAALGGIGSYEEAAEVYRHLLERFPGQAKLWMSYGHVLKTIGRRDEGIAAYRRALDLQPAFGEVWWSLANLKTFEFEPHDVAAMEAALRLPGVSEDDRLHLHFALGKALEDLGEAESSFSHYDEGNRLRHRMLGYDADEVGSHVARSVRFFTPEFFAQRRDWGDPAPDPIFILGMPRAGSTLVEQILASHSLVEGTSELPEIPAIVRSLARPGDGGNKPYPECLLALEPAAVAALGRDYLDRARVQRKSDRPFFTDKMPNNWMHVGLIRLILPKARIIDARRHPLACCFSNFKQHFARGQGFTYSLADLGRYYADYVRLMDHVDEILPGRVHRIFHERLIESPEAEIRRLLDYLELPFEDACLTFHRTDRAVRTASSEQVRQPINRAGVDRWRAFEPRLQPLKDALGPVLDAYPS